MTNRSPPAPRVLRDDSVDWGSRFAFLMAAALVAIVLIYQEPPVPAADGPATPAAPAVAVAPVQPRPAPSLSLPPVSEPPASVAVAAVPPAPANIPKATAPRDGADALRDRGIGCAVIGATGTSLAAAVGPAEVAAVVAGVTLLSVSPILVGAMLGTAFLTGCAVGATATPLLDMIP